MSRKSKAFTIAILAWVLSSCSGEEPRFLFHELPIINGEPDENPNHNGIVLVLSDTSGGTGMCTGTLIGRQVVLTAAHCVDETDASGVTIQFGSKRWNPLGVRDASEVLMHPNFDWPQNDFALVRYSGDPPEGVFPIPALPPELELTDADVGMPLELVGFGQTETGSTGERLTITVPLEWVCTQWGGCSKMIGGVIASSPQNSICYLQNSGGICMGDSGGPALVVRGGREYVAGIHAVVAEDCRYYGCSTKVDEFKTFIDEFARPDGLECGQDSDCLSGFCADDRCCSSRCAGVCERCDLAGSDGLCSPIPDGTSCADNNLCNGEETCQDGYCQAGVELTCDDGIDCTEDSCHSVQGCQHDPKQILCDDGSVCTRDVCDPLNGCINRNQPDGYPCGECLVCSQGACIDIPDCPGGDGCMTAGARDPSGFALLLLMLVSLYSIRRR